MALKAFKLVPFTKTKEQIPLSERIFYVDTQESPEYWKDIVIISSSDFDGLSELHQNMAALKDHPKFKNKFVMINHHKNPEDKIEYMILEELAGKIPTAEETMRTKQPEPMPQEPRSQKGEYDLASDTQEAFFNNEQDVEF